MADPIKLHSQLLDTVMKAEGAPRHTTADQWIAWLDGRQRAGALRKSERDWLRLDEWLLLQGETSRESLQDYVQANQLRLTETIRGSLEEPIQWRKGTDNSKAGRLGDKEILIMPDTVDGSRYQVMISDVITSTSHSLGLFNSIDDAQAYLEMGSGHPFIGTGRYPSEILPGGDEYREILIQLPERGAQRHSALLTGLTESEADDILGELAMEDMLETDYGRLDNNDIEFNRLSTSERNTFDAILSRMGYNVEWKVSGKADLDFYGDHFREPNVLAHIRMTVRRNDKGERTLFLEEIQSDWHQLGRRRGYVGALPPDIRVERWDTGEKHGLGYRAVDAKGNQIGAPAPDAYSARINAQRALVGDTSAVPDAPFKRTEEWVSLAVKRAICWAVDNGIEHVAWTGGALQVDRQNQGELVDEIVWTTVDSSIIIIQALRGGDQVLERVVPLNKVEAFIGKTMAHAVRSSLDAGQTTGILDGDMLTIGGTGLRIFYDEIVPNALGNWLERFGAGLEQTHLHTHELAEARSKLIHPDGGGQHNDPTIGALRDGFKGARNMTATGFTITPSLREAALEGMTLFSAGPAVKGIGIDEVGAVLLAHPLRNLFSVALQDGHLQIHHDHTSLPRPFAAARGMAERNGTVHLNAAQLTPDQVVPVMMHEMFHARTARLIGDSAWRGLMRDLEGIYLAGQESANSEPFWAAARGHIQAAKQAGDVMTWAREVEEFGAFAVQAYEQAPSGVKSWVDRFVGHVKAWCLTSFGVQVGEVTPAELSCLAHLALRDAAPSAAKAYEVEKDPDLAALPASAGTISPEP